MSVLSQKISGAEQILPAADGLLLFPIAEGSSQGYTDGNAMSGQIHMQFVENKLCVFAAQDGSAPPSFER